MLRRVGFRYAQRIDPFDGGPHFVADASEISLITETRASLVRGVLEAAKTSHSALVAREFDGPPYFRAILSPLELDDAGVRLPVASIAHLGVGEGDAVSVLPLH